MACSRLLLVHRLQQDGEGDVHHKSLELCPQCALRQHLSGAFDVSGEVRALEHAASGREDERCDGVQVVKPIPAFVVLRCQPNFIHY